MSGSVREKIKTIPERTDMYEAVICAISFVFGVLYLSITLKAKLAGDDLINGVTDYYNITHNSLWSMIRAHYSNILEAFTFQTDRFFPMLFPPSYIRYWFYKSVGVYRMYIILYTYLDIAMISYLIGKVLNNRTLGRIFFCITPLFIGLWSYIDHNAMYSYHALVQATLFPMLLSGIFTLNWHDTKKKRYIVFAACAAFYSCATYELGFVFIIPIWGMTWIYVEKAKISFIRMIPAAIGEMTALLFNMLNRFFHGGSVLDAAYDGVQFNFDLVLICKTFFYQFFSGMPIVNMLKNGVSFENAHASDCILATILAIVAVAIIRRSKPITTVKNRALLILVGLSLMTAPAALISLSFKYQHDSWVCDQYGWIPSLIQTFGFVIIISVVLSVVIGFVESKKNAILTETVMAFLVLCLAVMGIYQRSAARLANEWEDRQYSWFIDSISSGLLDCGDDDDEYVSYFELWGTSNDALNRFIARYTDRDLSVTCIENWTEDAGTSDVYIFGLDMSTIDDIPIAWVGAAADDSAELMNKVTLYISNEYISSIENIQYKIQGHDGKTEVVSVSVGKLKQENNGLGTYYEIKDSNIVPDDFDINMDISDDDK